MGGSRRRSVRIGMPSASRPRWPGRGATSSSAAPPPSSRYAATSSRATGAGPCRRLSPSHPTPTGRGARRCLGTSAALDHGWELARAGLEAAVRGDGRVLAVVDRRLRAADERDPEGGLLEDPRGRGRRLAGVARRPRRTRRGDRPATARDRQGRRRLGGAAFAQSLVRLGLVDEYRLVTHPVAVGEGVRLFKDLPAPIRLRQVETRPFESATVHVYART